MASIKQLQNQIKTFEDFKKVVNIQKIVVMKEINQWKAVIKQVTFRNRIFNNYMLEISKKFGSFSKDWFSEKKSRAPIKRSLHFLMSNPPSDRMGQYSTTLFEEYIKENHKPDDLYIVIGEELGKYLVDKGFNVIQTMTDKYISSNQTYKRISSYVLRGFKDLLFIKAHFMFLHAGERKIHSDQIFPFDKVEIQPSSEERELASDLEEIFLATNISKVRWRRDVESVGDRLSKLAVEMKVYKSMLEYRLSMKMRELQSLDDKEKNIQEEIESVRIKMQRKRKENVTSELLTNATAFMVLGDSGEDE